MIWWCVCNQFILAPRGKLQQMDVLQTNRNFYVVKLEKKLYLNAFSLSIRANLIFANPSNSFKVHFNSFFIKQEYINDECVDVQTFAVNVTSCKNSNNHQLLLEQYLLMLTFWG